MLYEDIKAQMAEYANMDDAEVAHQKADELLEKVALHTGLSKHQRKVIVNIYRKVRKWYA